MEVDEEEEADASSVVDGTALQSELSRALEYSSWDTPIGKGGIQ